MSEYLGYLRDDSEDLFSEFLDDEGPEQLMLPCSCETCGFATTLLYQEGERKAIEDIAKSMHEQESPNCNGELSF